MKSKTLSFVLIFALIFSFVPGTAKAAEEQTDTITVTLRIEDTNSTLLPSTPVTLTKQDVEEINQSLTETTVVETGSAELGTYETASVESL